MVHVCASRNFTNSLIPTMLVCGCVLWLAAALYREFPWSCKKKKKPKKLKPSTPVTVTLTNHTCVHLTCDGDGDGGSSWIVRVTITQSTVFSCPHKIVEIPYTRWGLLLALGRDAEKCAVPVHPGASGCVDPASTVQAGLVAVLTAPTMSGLPSLNRMMMSSKNCYLPPPGVRWWC